MMLLSCLGLAFGLNMWRSRSPAFETGDGGWRST